MHQFISEAIDENGDARWSTVTFDFGRLSFIDPTGVVVASNLIDYLREAGVRVKFRVKKPYPLTTEYLDDFGFFRHYKGEALRANAALRQSTVPLERLKSAEIYAYLENKLMPWIAARVGLEQESVAGVKTCFEEIFHNIDDHAGVKIGCVFAQFFPKNAHIHVAVSDFGVGIPAVVRRLIPKISDVDAVLKATEEGFTTKTNVRNRGAGLPTLIKYVTLRNKGSVQIATGKAELAATYDVGTKIRARAASSIYPGTLVKVILKTDTFEALAADVQAEEFNW
jgi:anti-sigma regulatory factor (Ser/Thr protein kinase)